MEGSGKKGIWAGISAIIIVILTIIGYVADISSLFDKLKSSPDKFPVIFVIQKADDKRFAQDAIVYLYSEGQFVKDTKSDSEGKATFLVPTELLGKSAKLKIQIDGIDYNKDILKLEKDDLPKMITLEKVR